jgi:hypothetical protein
MKLDITRDWFERMAAFEGDLEIGAGRRKREYPPAYGNCRCACHRSDLMHCLPCCHSSDHDFKCMDADIRKYLGIETVQDIVDGVSRNFAVDLDRIFGSSSGQKELTMTTKVTVEANHGWPVKVDGLQPGSNETVSHSYGCIVPAGEKREFYVHSTLDLRIHEVQPDEIAAEQPPAA